ncbi:protein HEADING DATE REPRESSOR 1 [Elaeis guineensis]|uniref:Protein HEADING DATE REPRESSOR 1 n=1 Tax=Elaeis guineensis var. tenera TaxID=51953 RepID=A0A6I9RN76_ELAGV|nr:protein HEADING DATE REPRESSOR 1 [Elaeis guineensis]
MEGFSPASPPRIFWNSRKRSAGGRSLENALREENLKAPTNQPEEAAKMDAAPPPASDDSPKEGTKAALSGRRRALFEPLEPNAKGWLGGRRTPAEVLLPPPDFDSTSYPKGWLVGKKRKLVNVDVVESMRRIAVQEMNRKDREIDGLNEQLEEDARCLEHLQVQLLQERSKRGEVERENAMLQDQVSMLMNMLEENQAVEEEPVAAPINP